MYELAALVQEALAKNILCMQTSGEVGRVFELLCSRKKVDVQARPMTAHL